MMEGKIQDHHVFKNSGWISFCLDNKKDVSYASHLLDMAYHHLKAKQCKIES